MEFILRFHWHSLSLSLPKITKKKRRFFRNRSISNKRVFARDSVAELYNVFVLATLLFFRFHLDLDVVMSFGQLCAPRPETHKASAASATWSLNGF